MYSRMAGWTRYGRDGSVQQVQCPQEPVYIFDIENCVREGPYPTLAVAVSDQAWYSWVSRRLAHMGTSAEAQQQPAEPELIPLQVPGQSKPVLVVGHAVPYDRQRVLDEYCLSDSQLRFLDTMSMHMATSGMASRQKQTWSKSQHVAIPNLQQDHDDSAEDVSTSNVYIEEEWIKHCSPPSLKDCYKHWCGKGRTSTGPFTVLSQHCPLSADNHLLLPHLFVCDLLDLPKEARATFVHVRNEQKKKRREGICMGKRGVSEEGALVWLCMRTLPGVV